MRNTDFDETTPTYTLESPAGNNLEQQRLIQEDPDRAYVRDESSIGLKWVMCIVFFYTICQRIMFYTTVLEVGSIICSISQSVINCQNMNDTTDIYNTSIIYNDRRDASQIFYGISYCLAVFFGAISDSYIGYFPLLLFGGILNCGAMLVFLLGFENLSSSILIWLGLAFLILGIGATQSSISVFGAYHLSRNNHNNLFYMTFYWFMVLGETIIELFFFYNQPLRHSAQVYLPSLILGCSSVILLGLFRGRYRKYVSDSNYVFQVIRLLLKRRAINLQVDSQNATWYSFKIQAPLFAIMVCFLISFFQSEYAYAIQFTHYLTKTTGQIWGSYYGVVASNFGIMFFIPCIWCLTRRSMLKCPFMRIQIGMIFLIVSLILAALVNLFERSLLPDKAATHRHLKILCLLLPQYLLSALSESLTIVAGYQIVYTYCDTRLKGVVTGFFVTSWGLGYVLVTGIATAMRSSLYTQSWIPNVIHAHDTTKLHYWYFAHAGFQIMVLGVYTFYRAMVVSLGQHPASFDRSR